MLNVRSHSILQNWLSTTKEIIICADADEAGLKAGKEADDAVGAYAIWPEFSSDIIAAYKASSDSTTRDQLTASAGKAPNDFNGLHCLCGLEAVRKQILKLTPTTTPDRKIWQINNSCSFHMVYQSG
ncbi:MAG: hypothetical protein LBJ03_03425 [Holosporales bacterium]|nr:hypothetical protein [Holosporales bacterium]